MQICLFQWANGEDYLNYTVRQDGDAAVGTIVVARSKWEAAKLYASILYHRGRLRALGDRPCVIKVDESKPNSNKQSFCARKAGNKIYVQCFIPAKRESEKYVVSASISLDLNY